MRKSALAAALATTMILSCAACGSQPQVQETAPQTEAQTESVAETETSDTETTVANETQEVDMNSNPTLAIRVTPEEEHYIFELSDNVTRTHVYYKNRFGIELAGDLYVAKDADLTAKYPAIVIGPPFGGVKEQGPGVYANQLAQRGFVVLTFDPAYHGYSGGEPRMVGSTDIYAEDFSAGVDYLGTLDYVNRDEIGAIGICGSGGFALSAAAMDSRIKGVVASVMYDISSVGNSVTGEARRQQLEQISQQRWADVDSGSPIHQLAYPEAPVDEMPEGLDPVTEEFFGFYGMERGWHPNARGNVTMTSMLSLMNFPSLTHIAEISPRPILFVVGENAHSRGFSDTAYANAAEPKEIYVVPDANHVDLYDQVDKIPFDKIQSFFLEAFQESAE